MNVEQEGIITLIKSALAGEKYSVVEGFSLTEAIGTIEKHNISSLIYYGALNCGYKKDSEIMKQIFNKSCAQLVIDENQTQALNGILRAFETEKIDYLPLKGTILKGLYPNAIMRAMGDIDVLVKSSQLKAASDLLLKLGFRYSHENDHESVWVNEMIVVDLHKRLLTSLNKDFSLIFGDGWKVAKRVEETSCRYSMSDENFFLFLFNHFAKHYCSSGIGIKHIVDLQVFITSKSLDFDYIESKLKKMELFDFYVNVMKVLDAWFEDSEPDEVTDFITDNVFGSGEFGLKEKAEVGGIVREAKQRGSVTKTKVIRFLKVVFLPFNIMSAKYKILHKLPILLPMFWCVRLFDVLINKRETLNVFLSKNKNITYEAIRKHQRDLNFVGLKYED